MGIGNEEADKGGMNGIVRKNTKNAYMIIRNGTRWCYVAMGLRLTCVVCNLNFFVLLKCVQISRPDVSECR